MIFNVPGHIEMIRNGEKTQTRRVNCGIYQIGRDYAVQRKRGTKAEPDIRIVMDSITEESLDKVIFGGILISARDVIEEGGYTPFEFENLFENCYPNWNREKRWAFKFHVIEVKR